MSQEAVRKLIPFTEADLEANRRLEVTDAQMSRLRAEVQTVFKWAAFGLIGSTIVLFVLAGTGHLAAILPRNIKNPDSPSLLVGFIALVGMTFAVTFFLNVGCWIQFRNYDEKRRVLVVEGKIERIYDSESSIIRVGTVEFYLQDAEYDAFTEDYYRVYYLDTREILSVETPAK